MTLYFSCSLFFMSSSWRRILLCQAKIYQMNNAEPKWESGLGIRPKVAYLALGPQPRRKFWGLISRWRTFFEWRYSIARNIWVPRFKIDAVKVYESSIQLIIKMSQYLWVMNRSFIKNWIIFESKQLFLLPLKCKTFGQIFSQSFFFDWWHIPPKYMTYMIWVIRKCWNPSEESYFMTHKSNPMMRTLKFLTTFPKSDRLTTSHSTDWFDLKLIPFAKFGESRTFKGV